MTVPLVGVRRRHRQRDRAASAGRADSRIERSYALAVKPATQVLARRTVKPIAKGESLTLSNDLFADLVPGTGRVALSVGVSTALDAAALLKALDRYPFGCSEQITSRALPLLYVNELAARRIWRSTPRSTSASATRSTGCWRGRRRTARSGCGRRRRRRRLARRLCDRLPDAGAGAQFRGAGHGVQARARPVAQLRRQRAGRRRRTAAAIWPMRSMCWRATARRRSAICAISPTPSSTTSRPRSPRRRSPRRSAMLGDRARAERVYAAALARSRSRRAPDCRPHRLRLDAARRRGAGHAGVARAARRAPPSRSAVQRVEAATGARALHLDAGERLDGAGGARARQGRAVGRRSTSPARRRKGALYRNLRPERARAAAQGDQHRRGRPAGGGHRVGRADRAGACGREGLQDRAQLLHARWQARRCDQGEAERAFRRGAARSPSRSRSSAASSSPTICRPASRSTIRGWSRPARPARCLGSRTRRSR